MSLRFHELHIRNFLSFGNTSTVINLADPGSTLIVGRNLDVPADGSASNGVGKSTIINAITYALYDKPLSMPSVSKDRLVNTINNKHMEVSVVFESKGLFYKITRARKMKTGQAGNYVKLWVRTTDMNFTDADEETLDSSSNTTGYIEKAIGIPYELFVRIVVFSGTHIPFLSLPGKHPTAPSQQSFIEELFDLKTLTEKAEVLKGEVKTAEQEVALIKTQVDMANKQKDHHERQLADARSNIATWERTRQRDIEQAVANLQRIDGVDLDAQAAVLETVKEAQRGEREIGQKIAPLERDLRDAETHISQLGQDLSHLHDATCPYCKQTYQDDGKVETTTADLDQLNAVAAELRTQLTALREQRIAAQAEVASLRENLQFDDLQELLSIKFKKDEIIATIERRQNETNPYASVLAMIEGQVPDEADSSRLNDLVSLIDHQKFLLKLLTKNDSFIRKAMLNKNLPFLNRQLNYYLRGMGLPHVVEFTHDLTPKITRYGSDFDINQLSTGQKSRVNVALALSFRDVLQHLHQKINLFCVDEVLDVGLDPPGVIAAAKLLRNEAHKAGTCMFVISHREEISSTFDKKMYVLYKDSFSRAYQTADDIAEAETLMNG